MNRILAGTAILVSCSLSAMAADIPAKAPPPSPTPAAAPAVDWTGFYVGGHLGGTGDLTDNIVDVDGLNGGAHYDIGSGTSVYGGQAGYNFQWGWLVVGVEGDYSSIRLDEKKFDPNFVGGTFSKLNGSFMYDVTGRAGFTYNGLFAYFKGGGVWTNIVASIDNTLGGFQGGRAYTGHFNGTILGGGVEWMVFPNWSVKFEYQRVQDLGTQTAVLRTPVNGNFRYSNQLSDFSIYTVGLNYHFFSWPNLH